MPLEHGEVRDLIHLLQIGNPQTLEVLPREEMVALHLDPPACKRRIEELGCTHPREEHAGVEDVERGEIRKQRWRATAEVARSPGSVISQ